VDGRLEDDKPGDERLEGGERLEDDKPEEEERTQDCELELEQRELE